MKSETYNTANTGYELPQVETTLAGIDNLVRQLTQPNADYFAYPVLRVIQSITYDALWTMDLIKSSCINPLPVIKALEEIPTDSSSELFILENVRYSNTEFHDIRNWYQHIHSATVGPLEDFLYTRIKVAIRKNNSDATTLEEMEKVMPGITRDPIQWDIDSLSEIAQWIDFISNPKHWRGDPPFYIFDPTRKPFMSVPRMYSNQNAMALFRSTYLTPRDDMLTDQQLDTMWSDILIHEQFYESVDTQPERRRSVLDKVMQQVPTSGAKVLDICGGTGVIVQHIRQMKPDNSYYLVDISSEGVSHAKELGIHAIRANVAREIPKEIPPVDLAIIFFSIQRLPQQAINIAYQRIKSGGSLILNVFPPGEKSVAATIEKLQMAGFHPNNIVTIHADNGIDTILKATKEQQH